MGSPAFPRVHRPGAWGAAAIGCCVLVAGFVVCMLLNAGGTTPTQFLDNLGETAAAMAAALCSALAARANRGRLRLAWALLAASAFSWGMGQVAWDWYQLVQGIQVPFPSLADAGYLGAVPLAIAGVLSFPVAFDRAGSLLHTLLDGFLIAAALLVVSWDTVLGAVYHAGASSLLATVLGLAYPLSDVAILTMVLVRMGRVPGGIRRSLLLVAAGLAVLAVADSSFDYLTSTNAYGNGNVLDSGWVAGYLLIGLGALGALLRPVNAAPPVRPAPRLLHYLPYAPVAIALGVIVVQRFRYGALDAFTFWTMLAMVVIVLVRQHLALRANVVLVGALATRERQMSHQAHHDALTDLANRSHFETLLSAALLHVSGEATPCAVLFLDLDDFKRVNDSFGHSTGDRVLRLVADRIRACLRPVDIAARLGGDEFAVLVKNSRSDGEARAIAERILERLHQPAVVDGYHLDLRATIGVAGSGSDTPDRDELLRRADVAMYTAKRAGKDRCAVYEPPSTPAPLRVTLSSAPSFR